MKAQTTMLLRVLGVVMLMNGIAVAAWNVGGTPATTGRRYNSNNNNNNEVVDDSDQPPQPRTGPAASATIPFTRSQFLQQTMTATVATTATLWMGRPGGADAAVAVAAQDEPIIGNAAAGAPSGQSTSVKRTNLSDDELKDIVRADVVQRQFLTNGKLTRSIYDESATFTDEIDTYTMDKWIVGTQRLFVGDKSHVNLVGDIDVNKERIEFRFDEDLMFNLPIVKPVVSLTGKVVLQRSPETGLITSYQEFWDQDVTTVLKSAKL